MNKMFINLFVFIGIIGFVGLGCAGDPRGKEDDRAAAAAAGGTGGQEVVTCVEKHLGEVCETEELCKPRCDGALVCIGGEFVAEDIAKGKCPTATSSSSSGSSSSSSGSSSGESSTSTSSGSSSSTSSSGGTGGPCKVEFKWTPTNWSPATDAKAYVIGEYVDPIGFGQGSWSVPGICKMVKDVNGVRHCEIEVSNGTNVLFTIMIDNPATKYGVSYSFDKGSYPGGGYGKQVGTTTVNGYTVTDDNLVSNGYANAYNAQIKIVCSQPSDGMS